MSCIQSCIKSCIQSWCNKHDITASSFSEWKQTVASIIDEKISHVSTKLTTENNKNKLGLKDKRITEELESEAVPHSCS